MSCKYTSESFDALQKSDPDAARKLISQPASDHLQAVSDYVSALNEYPFKPRPLGGGYCYLFAELNYANDLYICSLITDLNLRKQCETNAKNAYCEAFDLCGDPS